MDAPTFYGGRFEHSAFVWPSIFAERRERHYHIEDKITVEDERLFDTSIPLTTQNILARFLDYGRDGDRDRYLYVNGEIGRFLLDVDFDYLRQGSISLTNASLVLVVDCSDLPAMTIAPPEDRQLLRCLLNAYNLYTELRKSRCQASDSGRVNVNRRLIYIPDTNPHCLLALLATTSMIQLPFLRDFIYRNLAFESFVGVKIPPGFKSFALEFHLPYFCWRRPNQKSTCGSQQSLDSKIHRIRQSQKVRYLNTARDGKKDSFLDERIYEAQVSILVTGIDDYFWTSYCFADIYFKNPSQDETAQYYYQQRDDPHSGGKDDTAQVVSDAREHFLRKLACRIEQVKDEWKNLIKQLLRYIERNAETIFAEQWDSTNRDLAQDNSYRWTIVALRKFANHLSKIITRWETFNKGEVQYFYSLAKPCYREHLAAINREVEELNILRGDLQHQTIMFEKMASSLATQIAVAENRALIRQSNFIKALTVITIFYLPLNLASSIYSMQSALLPEGVAIKDYVNTLLGLTFATLILVINLSHIVTLSKALRRGQDFLWALTMHPLNIFVGSCKHILNQAKRRFGEGSGDIRSVGLEMGRHAEPASNHSIEV